MLWNNSKFLHFRSSSWLRAILAGPIALDHVHVRLASDIASVY